MTDALERITMISGFLDRYFTVKPAMAPAHERLIESMRYSLLQEGGKRFRPMLALLVAEALGAGPQRALAFGAAVECVHTYSLIHDDLPAMDNDDFRRGLPTNHRAYDEATAILAGDGLLTEAFQMIVQAYRETPAIALRLIEILAQAAGAYGMVGGQAIDMHSKKETISVGELREMHTLKTGALIIASATGAAVIAGADEKSEAETVEFATNLGLAFQVADDLLDFDPARPEPGSYPALLGVEKTREFLDELTEACLNSVKDWPEAAEPLRAIARYNRDRKK